jgi:hypothetical protein
LALAVASVGFAGELGMLDGETFDLKPGFLN